MPAPRFPGVVVVGAASAEARPRSHAAAVRAVCELTGAAASEVRIVSRCRHCGGPHGALVAIAAGTVTAPVFVSISRASGMVAAAATLAGPVGIDIESEERMSRASVDLVAFHPRELKSLLRVREVSRNRERTRLWTQKEALLKATGLGLRVPPSEVWLAGVGAGRMRAASMTDAVYVREAPSSIRTAVEGARFYALDDVSIGVISLPADLVGTVCVLAL